MDLVASLPAKVPFEPPLPANTTPRDLPKATHYPSLDGLRGLAACMVVYGHAGYFCWVPLLSGCATIGVLLFFFLSGFLMGDHYLPAPSSGFFNRSILNYWAAFLLRRFLRVYPPYFFAPILGYLLLMPLMPPDFEVARPFQSLSVVHELANIAAFKGPQGIYWTIQVELFFYMLYPFIITLCLLFRNAAGALFLVFCALTLSRYLVPLGQWPGFTAIFVAGVFTAVMAKKTGGVLDGRLLGWHGLSAFSFLVLILIVALVSHLSATQMSIWRFDGLFAVLFFVMFISLIRSGGAIGRMLSTKVCAALGRASYSLYLVHIIAFYIVVTYVEQAYRGKVMAVVVLIILTSLYHVFVEKPFVRLSKRIVVNK